ncbi:hypothetical protein COO09_14285 [Rhizorhabdus dicambivorans]|uniref:Uncharacterized protein n=1 Tax=Rhizorhabdus dicambivorans TaxID=1850238 RepID=A0A2A4FVD9_9SPHN|nr:hypothetical protein CMV14_09360 [Rhizorhabdus dicambivorans]PCE41680.1 hypothetical protein COO09_14285 [Rhizorhabdus dicambivorans]
MDVVLARPACSRRAGVPELVAGIIFRSGFDVVLTPLGLAPTAVSVRSDSAEPEPGVQGFLLDGLAG